jgi:hypothetical protein
MEEFAKLMEVGFEGVTKFEGKKLLGKRKLMNQKDMRIVESQ